MGDKEHGNEIGVREGEIISKVASVVVECPGPV